MIYLLAAGAGAILTFAAQGATLTVNSSGGWNDIGVSTPYGFGANFIANGTGLTNYMLAPEPPWEGNGWRLEFRGWNLTNNLLGFLQDSTTNVSFTIDTNTTLTWRWTNTYFLVAVTSTPGGSVDMTNRWHLTNSVAVTTNLAIPDAGSHFLQWSGDIPDGFHTNNPLIVTSVQPRFIQANFASDSAATRIWAGTNN